MARRTLLLTGGVFLACAILGAALVYDGALLGSGAPAPMAVRVANDGAQEITALIEVNALDDGWSGRSQQPVAPGSTREMRIDRVLAGDVFVKVTVSWSGADGRERRGDLGVIVDPATCASGETMVVAFRVDTAAGVSFGPTERVCQRL